MFGMLEGRQLWELAVPGSIPLVVLPRYMGGQFGLVLCLREWEIKTKCWPLHAGTQHSVFPFVGVAQTFRDGDKSVGSGRLSSCSRRIRVGTRL